MSSSPASSALRDDEKHLRDVVALSTLPAVWLGAEPLRIAESLAAALFTTVGADLVCVCLDCSDQETFAVAQIDRNGTSPAVAEELGPAILEWAPRHDPDELLPVPSPTGRGTLRLTVRPLGFGAECGAIAAGFLDGRSPDAFQHLLLNIAATQATTAVQNIRLLRSLRQNIADREQSEARERQAYEELEALHGVSRTLVAQLDLEELLQSATGAATRLSGAKYGAFFYNVKDGDGEAYALYALSGAPREVFEQFGIPRNSPLFEPTLRASEVVRLHDVRNDRRYGRNPPHYGMPTGHPPIRSYLAVPVVSRSGDVLGGMFFGHPDPGVFTDRSERLAVGIAAHAAIAIDNARLYGQAQKEIAERRRTEETLRLLNRELNHRVKNTLATVQAIAHQTLSHASNPKDFVDSFGGRIRALSGVHTLLTQSSWQGTDLKTLVREQLLGTRDETRLTVRGSAILLEPEMTLHLAMVLHELGTNSQKYGALSVSSGSVALSWTVDAETLVLRWVETGGPAVAKPVRRGFGSRLIEQSTKAHGGTAQMSCGADGIAWDIKLPLPRSPPAADAPDRAEDPVASDRPPRSGAGKDGAPVAGRRILVVEDEPLIGMDLVASLGTVGMDAIGPAASIDEALAIIHSNPLDCALLDANLNGQPVDEIAAALTRRKLPFAFLTGYSRESLPEAFRGALLISKPLVHAELIEAIRTLLSRRDEAADEVL